MERMVLLQRSGVSSWTQSVDETLWFSPLRGGKCASPPKGKKGVYREMRGNNQRRFDPVSTSNSLSLAWCTIEALFFLDVRVAIGGEEKSFFLYPSRLLTEAPL